MISGLISHNTFLTKLSFRSLFKLHELKPKMLKLNPCETAASQLLGVHTIGSVALAGVAIMNVLGK